MRLSLHEATKLEAAVPDVQFAQVLVVSPTQASPARPPKIARSSLSKPEAPSTVTLVIAA